MTRRRPRCASVWMPCLMMLFLPMLAGAQESTSPAPSSAPLMVPLETALEELTTLKLECLRQLDKQKSDSELRLYEATQRAAAEAVKAVMVELAGVEAERDSARRVLRKWQVGTVGAGVVAVVCVVVTIAVVARR